MAERYLTAKEATEQLGVTRDTLYAYVSRGLIRSEAADGSSRARRYHTEDVQRLIDRKAERANPARVAEAALNWGMPVLDSSLTLIADGRLTYRGHDATALATTQAFEAVAALLWTGELEAAAGLFALRPHPNVPPIDISLSLFQRMMTALVLESESDLLAYNLSPQHVAQTGVRILNLLTQALVGWRDDDTSIAVRLAAAWCPGQPDAQSLMNAALILCADHELNASSFAARVAASADTQPYGVVMAGLATLQGLKHGGNTARVAALLREIETPERARQVIAERIRRGEGVPGFGHHLYPDGDPRAVFLLEQLRASQPDSASVDLADAVTAVMREGLSLEANIDFALVVLTRALQLPDGAALALFALGRTAGWIAHAIEQYGEQQLIRPRARYVGPPLKGEQLP
jgi:citrate synthase